MNGNYLKQVRKNTPASLQARFRLCFFDFAGAVSERTSALSSSSSVTVALDGRLFDTGGSISGDAGTDGGG
jgi:hypothetical protein